MGFSDCVHVGARTRGYKGRNKHLTCPVVEPDGSATTLTFDGVACPDPGDGARKYPFGSLKAFLSGVGSEQAETPRDGDVYDGNHRLRVLYVRWSEKGRYVEPKPTRIRHQLDPLEITDTYGNRHRIVWGHAANGNCWIEEEDSRDCEDAWNYREWLCKNKGLCMSGDACEVGMAWGRIGGGKDSEHECATDYVLEKHGDHEVWNGTAMKADRKSTRLN